eukprot:CAMPEP_0115366064 /NCGR_PEP_ID=MMETSP0270-20121206/104609_1 /TAXON_ID=71861 /ORGANISM="Scrippsiella trochoidea, Strain CCMP3099" /LENGTH=177 /DNA_ID=CAMNT_0002788817 /DNA_START=57 /DNA_END=587 /DNA_ORIENTATION=+
MAARRNFLQVRYADMVYVVGWRLEEGKDQFTGRGDVDPRETPLLDVGGGTGWACQWYVDRFADGVEDPAQCRLFFFDDAGPPWARKDPATEGKWNTEDPAQCKLFFFDDAGPPWARKDPATEGKWNRWNVERKTWEPLEKKPPKPFGLYAGIGATRLSCRAESAIRGLYDDAEAAKV